MQIRNPQNQHHKLATKKNFKKSTLQNPIQFIQHNQLNKSKSKMQYSFPKGQRFNKSQQQIFPDKFYQLPPVLNTTRSSSFGYGTKIDFGKAAPVTPSPGKYQILREFQSQSKHGSYMGLSRQQIKFNQVFKLPKDIDYPQPASYNISFKGNGRKISIGQRFTERKKWIDLVPGPGNYNHEQPTTKLKSTVSNFRSSPTAKFSKTQRLKQILSTDKITPGPGNYKLFSSIKKDGTTFGRSQRDQKLSVTKNFSPGPGAYEMFSQFLH